MQKRKGAGFMKKKLGLGSGVAICVGLIVATSCLVSLGTDKVGSLFKIRETLALDTFANSAISFIVAIRTADYLFTLNFSQPSFRKPTICLAAAIPAFIFASAVWAPIFFGVEK